MNNFRISSYRFNKISSRSLKKYFDITTKRITLLGMLLALNIICGVISQYVLGPARIGGFLSFSITLWTVLIVFLSINSFYTFIFLELTEFMRMALGQDIVSTMSLNLSDLTFLLIFALLVFVMNSIRKLIENNREDKKAYFIVICIAMLIATVGAAGMDIVYNKYFMINWYYKTSGSTIDISKGLLIMIFWFNIVNYAINCFIFMPMFNVASILAKRFNQ